MTRKIGFVIPQTSMSLYGGAEVQAASIMEHLNRTDTDLRAHGFNPWEHRVSDFDALHIFGPGAFPSESVAIAKKATDRGVRVVVSPIFYLYLHGLIQPNSDRMGDFLWRSYLRLRRVSSTIPELGIFDLYRNVERVLTLADLILPNTMAERQFLEGFFHFDRSKSVVVPNGVDIRFRDGKGSVFSDAFGFDQFILFVGRIEPRKNLVRLIRAFCDSGLEAELVIVGEVADHEYFRLCKQVSNTKVVYLPPFPHSSDMLASAYKAAKVVALPSYHETPGLSALEGALAGANIVVTKLGGPVEYFEGYAWFVDPLSEPNIRESLVSAYQAQKSPGLARHIESNFTWPTIASKLVPLYFGL